MRKFLYTTSYSGWTSCCKDMKAKKFAFEYQPIIGFLEAGGRFVELSRDSISHQPSFEEPGDAVLKQFTEGIRAHMGKPDYYFCLLGASDLNVGEVPDGADVLIVECDGGESYTTKDQADWL